MAFGSGDGGSVDGSGGSGGVSEGMDGRSVVREGGGGDGSLGSWPLD